VGFYPRQVCDDITNTARDEIITAIGGIDSWANSKVSDDDDEALQREINIVRLEARFGAEWMELMQGAIRGGIVARKPDRSRV